MTTPTTPIQSSSNKTALRASLKKEDESLAERLAAADLPLVAPPEPAVPAAAAATPDEATARPAATRPAVEAEPAAPAKAAKAEKKPASTKVPATAAAPSARSRRSGKKAAPGKPGSAGKAAKVAAPVAPAPAKESSGKKAAKVQETVATLEKAAREKGDKLVRYTVELLKSEEAAIEAVRAELAKAAGWAASKSDILRAGVRLIAGQRLEQMKELLAALATAPKGKKKG
ncbi:MAG: hypothetical protein V5B33_10815 [Candidatus Accumulibacter sp. UW20]|jgi:hypothetical protein